MRLEARGGNNRSALPLPLAGEGWGGGAASEVDVVWQAVSPTPRALSSASTSPASGRGEENPRTDRFNQKPSSASGPESSLSPASARWRPAGSASDRQRRHPGFPLGRTDKAVVLRSARTGDYRHR